jgi:GDPmannose 4,6-dehydratase
MSLVARAIIVGSGGQDGRLLRRSLQAKGIGTVGISRHRIHYPDGREDGFSILDELPIRNLLSEYQPHHIYYLAAHHTSAQGAMTNSSLENYSVCHNTHVVGLHHFLEAIRVICPNARIFYASSSLIFDGSLGPKQSENTPFGPIGFYGLTKLQGMMLCRHYCREYNLFASSGILFSHESNYRPASYLSKKIISAAYAISRGQEAKVTIGDLDSINDWGYAADYVEAFQGILRLGAPGDFVVATGEGHTVREFAQGVCDQFGLRLSDCVVEDKSLPLRRTGPRVGDYTKLKLAAGWSPSKSFDQMVQALVKDYLNAVEEA